MSGPRESIFIDLNFENIAQYNFKKTIAQHPDEFLLVKDTDFDENLPRIEEKFLKLKNDSRCKFRFNQTQSI